MDKAFPIDTEMNMMVNKFLDYDPIEFSDEADPTQMRNYCRIPERAAGTYMLISFDIINSTAFKNEYPTLWTSVFLCFYGEVLFRLAGMHSMFQQCSCGDKNVDCNSGLWKLIGDEILLYASVKKAELIYPILVVVNGMLDHMLEHVANHVVKRYQSLGYDEKECEKIKKTISENLGVKATAWLADCEEMYTMEANNIAFKMTMEGQSMSYIDFLGKDVDEGFRLAKYAVKNKVIVSPLLAWTMWTNADEEIRPILETEVKITGYATLKGVWRGRKVPIVMFCKHFDHFEEILEYDETDSETYSNLRDMQISDFLNDPRFSVRQLDKILDNVAKKEDAQKVLKKLDANPLPEGLDLTMIKSMIRGPITLMAKGMQ